MNIKIKTFNKSVTTLQTLNFTHWKFPAGEIVFKDGKLVKFQNIVDIRARVDGEVQKMLSKM